MLLLASAAFVLGAPPQTIPIRRLSHRDLSTVSRVLDEVKTEIDQMVTIINQFSGSSDQFNNIRLSSETIIKTMDLGSYLIQASHAMELADTIGILEPLKILTEDIGAAFAALKSKRPLFDQHQVAMVLNQLNAQQTSAKTLSQAVIANLPMPSKFSLPLPMPLVDKFDVGIRQWSSMS